MDLDPEDFHPDRIKAQAEAEAQAKASGDSANTSNTSEAGEAAPRKVVPLDELLATIGSRLALASLLFAGFLVGVWVAGVALHDPDTCWLLALGREIVQTHAIPAHDPFSWTFAAQEANGQRFILYQWLSEVVFYLGKKGDSLNPPTFMWNVQYETSNDGVAAGGANLVKGDSSVKWRETKITDPKSIYKMKYEISQVVDVANELKQGNKAMKELFGFDLDKLTGIIDPTNPQTGMAGAMGTRLIKVTIWSPYIK